METTPQVRLYPKKPDAVYYFGTCLIDLFYPNAGLAGMKLLEREGVKVIFPQGQSCCGQPAFNSGHPDEARTVAAMQVELFSTKGIPVVVPSGSCAGMMRKHYPELFAGHELEEKAKVLSEQVFELTEFLVHVLGVDYEDLGEPTKVTWHPSCHAQREMGIRQEPKSLLRQLKNVDLVELERESECCGFGGTFAVRQPEISGAMVKDKVADVVSAGAETLVSGDCGCLMNISGVMEKDGVKTGAKHIAEFLWERTNDGA